MEVIRSANPRTAAHDALINTLQRFNQAGVPILFLLSGGSALTIVSTATADQLDSMVTISVLDERCTSDTSVNNFAQLSQTDFYTQSLKRGVATIETLFQTTDTPLIVQARWEVALRTWRATHPTGRVIVTMGIGSDGHTAGLFPGGPTARLSGPAWTASYTIAPAINHYTERMTVTYTFLREVVDHAIVFAIGTKKRAVLEQVIKGEGIVATTPALILTEMSVVQMFVQR